MAPRKLLFLDEFGPFVGIDEMADITSRRLDRMRRDADRGFSGTAILPVTADVSGVVSDFRASNDTVASYDMRAYDACVDAAPNRAERRSVKFGRNRKSKR